MDERPKVACTSRVFWLALCSLLPIGAVLGQPAKPGPPDVEILKIKWEKQMRLPRNFDPSTIPTGQVFTSPDSRTPIPGSTAAPITAADQARADSVAREQARGPVDIFPNAPARMPYYFVYSLKIRNAGSKTIEGVSWDYLFLDPDTHAVLGDHHLFSYKQIPGGKTVTLQQQQRTRPVTVVRAPVADDGKKHQRKELERAVIKCIIYSDGTEWKNRPGSDSCEVLKRSQPGNNKQPDAKR